MDEPNNNQEVNKETTTPQETKKEEVTLSTIMPSMIDEENDTKTETKQDLSAIIPKSVQSNGEGTQLLSQEDKLKSDGCITLGIIQGEGIAMSEGAAIPEQIDIEKRKKEAKELENSKRKVKSKRDIDKAKKEMKNLNKKTIIILILFAVVIAAFVYIKKTPEIGEFEVINFDLELGESLPTHSNSYAKAPLGKNVDDLTYKVDTSSVVIDKVGEYQFIVTHGNITKIGLINVVDTTGPELVTRDIILTEGNEYSPKDFVQDCNDYNGCDYYFEKEEVEGKYTKPGDYDIHIVAKDAYNNSTTKKASLTIEEKGKVKFYTKDESLEKYKLTTKYEIHFQDIGSSTVILNATETLIYNYYNEEDFTPDADLHYGEEGCTIDRNKKMIKIVREVTRIGDYNRLEEIVEYLESNGYHVE